MFVGWRVFFACIALLCAFAGVPSSPAFAHATLLSSSPADGAMAATSPSTLTLTFNEPVSALVLRLIGPDGRSRLLPNPEERHEQVEIPVSADLAKGTHAFSWRVISLDGHPVGGTIVFSVGAPSSVAPSVGATSDAAVVAGLWLAKVILYVGLFIGIGGAFFGAWIARRPVIGSLLTATLIAGIAAAVIAVGLQGLDALGVSILNLSEASVWQSGMGTSFGATVVAAVPALILSLLSLAVTSSTAARAMSLAAMIGVGVALALSGHASAAAPQIVMRPAVFIHAVSLAFWIGALVPLAAVLRAPLGADVVVRFSRTIPWSVAALIASGIMLAIVQVQQADALVTTAYGRILSAKLVLVILLLALAALNRLRVTPAVLAAKDGARCQLRRMIVAEVILVTCILGLVAVWRFTPPPRALAIAAAQPALLHIHTNEAMADVRFEPGHAGSVRVNITIMTGDFGALDAKEVQLSIENKSAGIEPISRPAVKDADSAWHVDHVLIPQSGQWDVRLDILVDDFHKIILEGHLRIRGT